MEIKKYDKVDIDKKRWLFLQIGFIITFAILLTVFEWTVYSNEESTGEEMLLGIEIEIEMLPVVREKDLKPPEPKPQFTEQITIVDDETELELDVKFPAIDKIEEIEMIPIEIEEEDEEPVYFFPVETMPEFPGGVSALKKYIAKNLKYPSVAINNDIQGKVFVRFIITHKGEVDSVSVLKSVHPLLDKEAIRVVKELPDWKPETQRGKTLSVWYSLPVTFIIH